MKNRQLMRLNKVSHNGIIKTVDCISPGYISFLEDTKNENEFGFWVDLDDVSFIPLTEEILLKCGFIESSKHDFKLMLKICGINLYCRFNTEWYFELEGIYLGAKPKHLHELQNLYFALLGSELTIKGL